MEEIINNIMQSPENTNPNVLRSQLQNISSGDTGGSGADGEMSVYTVTGDLSRSGTIPNGASIAMPTFDENGVCEKMCMLRVVGDANDFMSGDDFEFDVTMYLWSIENGEAEFAPLEHTPTPSTYAIFAVNSNTCSISDYNFGIGDMTTVNSATWTITIMG